MGGGGVVTCSLIFGPKKKKEEKTSITAGYFPIWKQSGDTERLGGFFIASCCVASLLSLQNNAGVHF